jgi:hypothetical protein
MEMIAIPTINIRLLSLQQKTRRIDIRAIKPPLEYVPKMATIVANSSAVEAYRTTTFLDT